MHRVKLAATYNKLARTTVVALEQVVQGKKLLDVNFNVRFLGSHNTSDDGRAGLAGLAGLQGKLAALKGSSNGENRVKYSLTHDFLLFM